MGCRAADRLMRLCEALNLTPTDFALHLDISLRRATRVLRPTRKPSLSLMARVQRAFPHVNAYWLLCGEGTMFRDAPAAGEPPNGGNNVVTNYGTLHQNIFFNGQPPFPPN